MSSISRSLALIVILFLISLEDCFSLPFDTALVRLYGGPGYEIANSMKVTPDSGIVLVGTTNYYGQGGNSIYLVRTDKNGIHKWSKTLGGSQIEIGYDVAVLGDSGILVVGYTNSFGNGGYDGFIAKTDTAGNLIWQKTIGGTDWDFLYSISMLSDGSAILCGKSYSYSNGASDGYVVKIDSQGNEVWSTHVGGVGDESLSSSVVTTNNIFLVGTSDEAANDSTKGYLVKLDLSGNLLNEYFFTSNGKDGFNSIKSFNGSLLIGGFAEFPDSTKKDIWLIKMDESGNTIWNNIGSSPEDDYINDVAQVTNDNIVLVGQKNPSGTGEKSMFMVRTDSMSGYISSASFGGALNEEGNRVITLPGKKIAFCGYSTSYGAGNEDMYLVILPYDTITSEYTLDIINYTETHSPIGINEVDFVNDLFYPNPSSGIIYCDLEQGQHIQSLCITSVTGLVVYYSTTLNNTVFDFTDFSKGMYFYEVTFTNRKMYRGKIVFQ